MKSEYVYYSKVPKSLPLRDDIKIISQTNDDEFFISNSKEIKAHIYAEEIDFFLKNSTQDCLEKAKSVSILYEIRSLIYSNSKEEFFYDELGELSHKSFIDYKAKSCDYDSRRGEVCLKCLHVCPSESIKKDSSSKTLFVDHQTCINCGACVSICPTGSLDFTSFHRESFLQVAKMLKGKIILAISSDVDLSKLNIQLPKDVIPLILDTKIIDELHLLTLLQESGACVVFYANTISKPLASVSSFINEIYSLRFGQDGIFLCSSIEQLQSALDKADFIQDSYFSINNPNLNKRQISSQRLEYIVANNNFGAIKTPAFANYALVHVDEQKCTLCLSCAGACKSGALNIDKQTNSLLFNASLCTGCGYCELNCAEEDCLHVTKGELALNKQSFTSKVLASDELFKCVECGSEFATKKSVEKIASMLKDAFANDELKLRSLYCCSDCKAKLMAMRVYELQKAQMEAVNG